MTRAQHRPGTRPPIRRDSRRPGGTASPRPAAERPTPAPSPAEGRPSTTTLPGSTVPPTTPPAEGRPSPTAGTPRPPAERTARIPSPDGNHPSPTTAVPRPPAGRTTHVPSPDGNRPSPTGTTPPRVPARGPVTATPPGGKDRPSSAPTRPADNRPPTLTGRRRRPAGVPVPATGRRRPLSADEAASVRAARAVPAAATRPPAGFSPPDAPGTAHEAPRRPAVPQPRPTDRFAELLLAVLSGQRPVHAMLRHTAGRAYDELVLLAERGPLRTRGVRPVVRDIGWFEPREGAIEAFARIGAGDRLRAMAFRLERGRDLRWRCTAVELGGPRPHTR
ncbi:Rv3235 family protein [Streptomyces sp. NPDC018955]|uniref:Rv3235 family protein n=1 Tax=Streptomyces sp. NPDC018955 TaxID=3365055 RepID=UPI00379BC79A